MFLTFFFEVGPPVAHPLKGNQEGSQNPLGTFAESDIVDRMKKHCTFICFAALHAVLTSTQSLGPALPVEILTFSTTTRSGTFSPGPGSASADAARAWGLTGLEQSAVLLGLRGGYSQVRRSVKPTD